MRHRRVGRLALGLALTVLAATVPAGGAGAAERPPCGWRSAPPDHWDHVVWIWMENKNYDQVIDDRSAPFTTWLAHECGRTKKYSSVGGPSLPNYLGATSGDTHGIHDDDDPAAHHLSADNIFRQVRHSGRPSRTYAESMPQACALENRGRYAVRHNPAAYYVGANDRAACRKDDVPLDGSARQLQDDVDHWKLPAFTVVVPNVCHDTHDCDVGAGDRWLGSWLWRLWTSDLYKDGKTAVFIVWDEPTPMPNVVMSPSTPAGKTVEEGFDHYSLLRTAEEVLRLPLLGRARNARSMRGPFRL
ncbi:MAG TPA: alkaline phosphatase family protein [Acidimicrobiia bacterium]|nr:alkaline phosphatase family protein [Acidimicrobiia bacterium]